MNEKQIGLISTTQLKQLITLILDNPRENICIRPRLIGEMWRPNFMRVLMLNGKGVVLNDEIQGKAFSITYFSDIVQFEIDGRFQNYEPHFHYDVRAVEGD